MDISEVKPAILQPSIILQHVRNKETWEVGAVLHAIPKQDGSKSLVFVKTEIPGSPCLGFQHWRLNDCEPVTEEQRIASELEALQDS